MLIPTYWYRQCKSLALGVLPNAHPERKGVHLVVQYYAVRFNYDDLGQFCSTHTNLNFFSCPFWARCNHNIAFTTYMHIHAHTHTHIHTYIYTEFDHSRPWSRNKCFFFNFFKYLLYQFIIKLFLILLKVA